MRHEQQRRARNERRLQAPPLTAAKNDTINKAMPSSGIRKVPFMTWMKWPIEPVHVGGSSSHESMTDLSSVAPSLIHLNSPATAKTIIMAWMTTSIAMMSSDRGERLRRQHAEQRCQNLALMTGLPQNN